MFLSVVHSKVEKGKLFCSQEIFFILSPLYLFNPSTFVILFAVTSYFHPIFSYSFDLQVAGSLGDAETGLKQHLERLDEIFSTRADYLQVLRFMQLMVNNVVGEMTALPDLSKVNADLGPVADQTAFVEYYRYAKTWIFLSRGIELIRAR